MTAMMLNAVTLADRNFRSVCTKALSLKATYLFNKSES